VNDLKNELASLRLDEAPPRPRRGMWIGLVAGLLLVAGGALAWRARTAFAATEVDTTRPVIEQSGGSGGSPLLTASGYVVARRKAVVSAKIQGRLAELRVEEGSRVGENDILARLESEDYEAQVQRARAQVQQADAQVTASQASI
jgi:HlyD family secretion protein